jgi:hypothetical protein
MMVESGVGSLWWLFTSGFRWWTVEMKKDGCMYEAGNFEAAMKIEERNVNMNCNLK